MMLLSACEPVPRKSGSVVLISETSSLPPPLPPHLHGNNEPAHTITDLHNATAVSLRSCRALGEKWCEFIRLFKAEVNRRYWDAIPFHWN